MFKAVKFKLYPNQTGLELLRQNGGATRWLYNHFLDRKIKHYEATGESLSKYELTKEIPKLKAAYPWLAEVDSTSLQQAVTDLDQAYKNFFRRVKLGQTPGFPRFKRKSDSSDSFRVVMSLQADQEVRMLRLGKIGWMKARGSWENLVGKVKSITVSQDCGSWYASVLLEQEDSVVEHLHEKEVVAIDLGVVKPVCAFDGKSFSTLGSVQFSKDLEVKERRRARYQRQLSRKVKGSQNRTKARHKVQRAYRNERNFRKNFVEQTSHQLVTTFATVIFEDLGVKNMTKKVKGEPQKRKLNHNLLRLGHSTLVSRCQQKALRYGTEVRLVDPAYTSQCCNSCGSISKFNRKSQAELHCVECGHQDNADHNACRNIMDVGQGLYYLH